MTQDARRTSPDLSSVKELRAALKALLEEAKSGQHRRDLSDRECPPMEAAIAQAEKVLHG